MIRGQHAYQADKSGLIAVGSGIGIIIVVFGVPYLEFAGGKGITLTEVQQFS